MNNEPVAWMALNELNGSYSTFTNDQKQRLLPHVSQCYGKWIPLYTHPSGRIAELEQQLKEEIQARADALDDLNNRMLKFMKSYNEMAWKLEEVGGAYTHPVKEQDDYCKAYWGNDNKFVDVFLPNSETEVIRFWNNTHPVKELTDEEIDELVHEYNCIDDYPHDFVRACIRKAQEK